MGMTIMVIVNCLAVAALGIALIDRWAYTRKLRVVCHEAALMSLRVVNRDRLLTRITEGLDDESRRMLAESIERMDAMAVRFLDAQEW